MPQPPQKLAFRNVFNSNTVRKEASTLTALRRYCLYIIDNNNNDNADNNTNNLEDLRMLKLLYKPLTSSPLITFSVS